MIWYIITGMKDSDWFGAVSGLKHSGKESHLFLELMHTSKAMLAAFSREMGLPMSQLALLRMVAGAPERGIGVLEIARRMGLNGAAITRQVKKLESRGLVSRHADRHDGRRSNLELTVKGRALFLKMHRRAHELEDLLNADIAGADIETAKMVLSRMRAALSRIQ